MAKVRLKRTKLPGRRKPRLPVYDYSNPAWYFVTICTDNMRKIFGEIINGKMRLNALGKIVENCWNDIPTHYPNVELDYYVIMPNHVHGIIIINSNDFYGLNVGNENIRSLHKTNLSNVIKGFKIGVTKLSKQNRYYFKWQKSFYDRIIRNERELYNIRKYIEINPLKWGLEKGIENLEI